MEKKIVVVRKTGADRHMDNLEKEIERLKYELFTVRRELTDTKDSCAKHKAQCIYEQERMNGRSLCTECPIRDCEKNWYFKRGYGY